MTGNSAVAPKAASSTTLFRTAPPRARHLLVINKGANAVPISREGAAWDLMEIYFMDSDIEKIKANPALTNAEHVVFETNRQMRKFAIIKAVFQTNPFWEHYDSIAMFDDDVQPVGCGVADIFALFAETKCRIGQPALTNDSFYGHIIHLKNDNFIWRRGNLAELMCPIFTRDALRDYLPLFNATVSGFGLDDYWSFHEWLKGDGVAILDRTPVRHSRRVGGGAAYAGIDRHEGTNFMRHHGIPFYPQSCFDGVLEAKAAADASRPGPFVSGYDRALTNDTRFRKYIADQTAIWSNEATMAGDTVDPGVLDSRLAAMKHLAAVLLYVTTKDYPEHRGPIYNQPSFWDRIAFWR